MSRFQEMYLQELSAVNKLGIFCSYILHNVEIPHLSKISCDLKECGAQGKKPFCDPGFFPFTWSDPSMMCFGIFKKPLTLKPLIVSRLEMWKQTIMF